VDWLISRPVFPVVFLALAGLYLALKLALTRRHRQPSAEAPARPPGALPPAGDAGHWLRVLATERESRELLPALDAVGRSGDRLAVDALARLLAHEDPEVSAAAANALGRIGDERALAHLYESAERLEHEIARLGPGPEAEAEAPPPAAASGPALRPAPARPPEEDDLVWPNRARGRKLLEQHAKPGPERASRLLALAALAADREAPVEYRYFALKNLELTLPGFDFAALAPGGAPEHEPDESGARVVTELAVLLGDADPSIRYAAIGVLESCPLPEVVRYVEGATSDPNRYVRARACLALALVAPGRARKHLFALLSDPDDQVRRAARRALDEMGAQDAPP
jgi:HEAT repeat protein